MPSRRDRLPIVKKVASPRSRFVPQKFSLVIADIAAVVRVPVGNGSETRRRLMIVGYVSEDREVPEAIHEVNYRLAPVSLVAIIDELMRDMADEQDAEEPEAEEPEGETPEGEEPARIEPVRRVVRPKGIGGNLSVSYIGTAELAVSDEQIREKACEGLRRIAENGRKIERVADDYADCLQGEKANGDER